MARSIVGASSLSGAPAPREPLYKRLRSGYSIVDPRSQRVLGEIQPYLGKKPGDKKGWWMTYGAEQIEAPTVAPLFVVAGCRYRYAGLVTPTPALTRSDTGRQLGAGWWLRACGAGLAAVWASIRTRGRHSQIARLLGRTTG